MGGPGPFWAVPERFRMPIQAFERGRRGQNSSVEPSFPPTREVMPVQETLTLRLSGGPTAPARARTALCSLDRTLADLRDDVQLLVSELVSNSVIHAEADHVELRATADPRGVHIEVSDPGPGFDDRDRREPSFSGQGGFGLLLVDKVAHRWGVKRNRSARVWFEIDRKSGLPVSCA
jgi:anti-sigma regulatory factor (Ser/Thr protein kinase)